MLLKDFENCVDSLIDVSIRHMLVNIFRDLLDMISSYKSMLTSHTWYIILIYMLINSVL